MTCTNSILGNRKISDMITSLHIREVRMVSDNVWDARARGLLKAELARKDVTYEQLTEKLKAIGVNETPASIANKISRGRFTAVFLLQCLEAIGCRNVRLDES
jgi:Domain of unknown function (DUF6471)